MTNTGVKEVTHIYFSKLSAENKQNVLLKIRNSYNNLTFGWDRLKESDSDVVMFDRIIRHFNSVTGTEELGWQFIGHFVREAFLSQP